MGEENVEFVVLVEHVAPMARRATIDGAPSDGPLELEPRLVSEERKEGYLAQGKLAVGCSPTHSQ